MIFDAIQAWSDRRRILRELAAHQRAEQDRAEIQFRAILERLEFAMEADQHAQALRLCREVLQRLYPQAVESPKFFNVLLNLGEYDEAERLIDAGLARHPRENVFLVGHAKVAEERGDLVTALERWAIVRQKFPWLALAFARTAACLVKSGRVEEAEAMLAQGIKQSPDDVFCLIEHANAAEALGKLDEALVRWQYLIDVRPDQHLYYRHGMIGMARCLRTMGRLDDAEALLRTLSERLGVQEIALKELARISEAREDWPEALIRWQQMKAKCPMSDEGYRGVIRILKQFGQKAAVDRILGERAERFPDVFGAAFDYAQNAYDSPDKAEIARRWALVRQHFPDHEAAYRNEADALSALGQKEAAAALRSQYKARSATETSLDQ